MDILEKIRKLQGERDWTDYKLAQKAEIPYGTLSSMFQRKNEPKLDTLYCICKAFGLTLSQFFLEDEKTELLSQNETKMLEAFRKLSEKQQEALIALFAE